MQLSILQWLCQDKYRILLGTVICGYFAYCEHYWTVYSYFIVTIGQKPQVITKDL